MQIQKTETKNTQTPENTKATFTKVGGAWVNENSISLKLNNDVTLKTGDKIYLVKNKFKDTDKKPDYNITAMTQA